MIAQDDHYQTLTSRLALAQQAADSPGCGHWKPVTSRSRTTLPWLRSWRCNTARPAGRKRR